MSQGMRAKPPGSPSSGPCDLAFVGAGVSCAFTLLHILNDRLKAPQKGDALRLVVIERDEELWTGFAYGQRSSANSLLISNLREFLPEELRGDFFNWLAADASVWVEHFAEEGGAPAEAWLRHNADAIAAGNWDELFLPRRLFGAFLTQRVETAIAAAEARGLITLDRIRGEVTTLSRADTGYIVNVTTKGGQHRQLVANCVVLGIGSPPARPLARSALAPSNQVICLDEVYAAGLDHNIDVMSRHLASLTTGRNLLVIGSNASALEIIYLCNGLPQLKNNIDKIVCLSPSGELPDVSRPIALDRVELPRLELLKAACDVRSEALQAALKADIAGLEDQGIRKLDAFPKISDHVVAILRRMSTDEARHFHHHHGMNFTRQVRRSGQEYVGAGAELVAAGRLVMTKGAFVKLHPGSTDAHVRCDYHPSGSQAVAPLPDEFAAVLNCTGFDTLHAGSPSPLIASLLRQRLCAANPSRRGLEVNDSFEAAPGLFVAGPLLAGIFNERLQTWHIENARRIYLAAKDLSRIVVAHLERVVIVAQVSPVDLG